MGVVFSDYVVFMLSGCFLLVLVCYVILKPARLKKFEDKSFF